MKTKFLQKFPQLVQVSKRYWCGVTLGPVTQTLPEVCSLDPDHLRTHQAVYDFSLRDPKAFWGTLAQSRLQWAQPFHSVQKIDHENAKFEFFGGGKLNVTVNCVDRHAAKNPEKVAIIWEKDEPGQEKKITYGKLQSMMCKMSNMLLSHGIQKGDRVILYMPMTPMAVIAMLGCARIGAIHSVVFAGFSPNALATRINDAEATTVITADEGIRGGKTVPLKAMVDDAIEQCPGVKRVFVMNRTGNEVPWNSKRDIKLDEVCYTTEATKSLRPGLNELEKQSSWCYPEPFDSEDPLFMLYTSGSTGKPKGIIHTNAGYLLYAMLTHKLVFETRPNDIFGCVADIGWITGHSYVVYGPLANGVTTVIFESVPSYPDPGRYWETVNRLGITQFYGAPTALRLLIKFGDQFVKNYDRSSLRVLGSVGEPINHEAWQWYHDVIGSKRCMVVDTWWQTETGGICLTPCPAEPGAEIKPAIAMRPFYGIEPMLLDARGNEANDGALCLAQPWPGMARTIYGDHDRYKQTYFSQFAGYYCTGDGAHRDLDGDYAITGRMDDVINVSGHRLGTAEIEDVLSEHHDVAESAVVSFPHSLKGDGIFAFVVMKDEKIEAEAEIIKDLKHTIKKEIAAYAVPDHILVTPNLPKTRSGKIMRRILRKIITGKADDIGDMSTLAEPEVMPKIISKYNDKYNGAAVS